MSLWNRVSETMQGSMQAMVNAGKNMVMDQASLEHQELMNALNSMTGLQFENVGAFLNHYRSNYFKTAYKQLDPFTCIQLAITSPYIVSAIDAIVKPIAKADFKAVPKSPENKPNTVMMPYMEWLINNPNPYQTKNQFIRELLYDYLRTGQAFIEVGYGDFQFPARLDRVEPYIVKPVPMYGEIKYVRRDNGYVFPDQCIIPYFNSNPFSRYKGLSKLVALFVRILNDEALMEHYLRYFVQDTVKGIISVSDQISTQGYKDSIAKIKAQIEDKKSKGESGHLIVHGATFQGLGNTNRDMLTNEIEQSNINAISAVFQVPPSKIMQIDSGNIGSGTGESQENSMNDTLTNEASDFLSILNFKLLNLAGINDTVYQVKNLTKTDRIKEAQLDTERLNNGTWSINDVKTRYGEELRPEDWANEPWMPTSRLPMSLTGKNTQNIPMTEEAIPANVNKRILEAVKKKGIPGAYIVQSTLNEI